MSEMRKDTIDPIYAQKMSDFRQWLDELLNGYRDTAWQDGYNTAKSEMLDKEKGEW